VLAEQEAAAAAAAPAAVQTQQAAAEQQKAPDEATSKQAPQATVLATAEQNKTVPRSVPAALVRAGQRSSRRVADAAAQDEFRRTHEELVATKKELTQSQRKVETLTKSLATTKASLKKKQVAQIAPAPHCPVPCPTTLPRPAHFLSPCARCEMCPCRDAIQQPYLSSTS
jgi:hypothetical protein